MKRLLLSAADPMLRRQMCALFRGQGYMVDEADRNAEAVRMALSGDYAVVVLDSDAIGMGAHEAASALMERVELVVVIGDARPMAGVRTLGKPIDMDEISHMTAISAVI